MLAQNYDADKHDPTGWYLSEKLDGVRAYWDGTAFWTRNGNVFNPPEFFVKNFPSTPMDGELWTG
jgi:DNA ligase-1